MDKTHVTVSVVTPDGVALESDTAFTKFMTTGGEMGVMPDHSPALASISPGELVLKNDAGEETKYFIATGTAEVTPDKVTILTPYLEDATKIDAARAKSAKERAEGRLNKRTDEIDLDRAQRALKRAETRLYIVELLLK